MTEGTGATGNYDESYYQEHRAGMRRSAERLLPVVFDLVRPTSVVDVGCGSGEWLAVTAKMGVDDILGIDGPWVGPATLAIPAHRFRPADLSRSLDLGRRFDLAICLEVAEHLPPAAAPVIVRTLTTHAPSILFSAAIPGQGGEGHVNETWPTYWRSLFEAQGFEIHDILRGRLWEDTQIDLWYRQNVLMFTAAESLAADSEMAARFRRRSEHPRDIVHPDLFAMQRKWMAKYMEGRERVHLSTLEALTRDHDLLRTEADELHLTVHRVRAENEAMRNSSSWRATAPLRWLRSRIQDMAGKLRGT